MTVAALLDSGQRIGRYQPLRRLAVGGMAEIYLARLPGVGIEGFEKLLVLKRILPQHALDPDLLRMFLDEARLSATLNHPNVVEVHDVGTDGEAPFFAMEYVHGANVREILRQHARATPRADDDRRDVPLPLGHAVAIVAAAAAGLHYAHECLGPGGQPLGIVHRDVSPSNVLVSYDGAVKVSDFGIAKWAFQRTRTQEGTLKGKFAYMSPEQCRGRAVDARSDVFALGAILYELTTGRPAFSGESDLDILNRIATGQADPPTWTGTAAEGEYPAALAAIVMRALAPGPAERYPTMGALQTALDDFARAAGLSVSAGALAAFMRALFADDIVAWQAAEKAGKSLAEHLATPTAAPRPVDPEDRTATDAFGPTRFRSRPRARARAPRAAALVGFLALSAVGGGWMAKRWQRTSPPASPVAASTTATTTTPVPIPPARPEMLPSPRPAVAITTSPAMAEAAAPPSKPRGAKSRRLRAEAPPAASRPTAEGRLGAWDPDSPVPP